MPLPCGKSLALIANLASPFFCCNETTYLAVLNGYEAVFLDRVESSKAIRTTSRVGSRIPLHCTGAGKAILAYQEENKIQATLEASKIKAFTLTLSLTVRKFTRTWGKYASEDMQWTGRNTKKRLRASAPL